MDDENSNWQLVIGIALGFAITALAGGYLGWLHPLGDSLSVGRGIAAAAILVIGAFASFAGLRMAAFVSVLLALLTGAQVLLAYNWPGPPGTYALYQKNMLYQNSDLAGLAADVRDAEPEIVTLQEVSEANLAMLAAVQDQFPNQHVCPGGRVGATAVLTSLAMVPGTAFCGPGMAAVQLTAGEDRFWVVSVHLHWPWPYRQSAHVDLLLPILARLDGPAILAGDFNMVRWANSVQRLADMLGVRPAGPTVGTYFGLSDWLRLPIDHVFATGSGRVAPRGAFGADHLGLLAEVEL